MECFGFTDKEIKANALTFEQATNTFKTTYAFHGFVHMKHGETRKVENPKGWFIMALKGEIEKLN